MVSATVAKLSEPCTPSKAVDALHTIKRDLVLRKVVTLSLSFADKDADLECWR